MTKEQVITRVKHSSMYIDDRETADYIIKALEQQSDDCVSRQAVLEMIEQIQNAGGFIGYNTYSEAFDRVDNMSPVTPTRKVGKWKKNEHTFWTCSECGLVNKYNRVQYTYCPNCGAEMRGNENGSN